MMISNFARSSFCAFLAALVVGCALLVAPSLSSQSRSGGTPAFPVLYINSSAQAIPTIFSQLHPDVRFAKVLAAEQPETIPHLQNLVLNRNCPTASVKKVYSCNGYHMVPQPTKCGGGRCGSGEYYWYYAGGEEYCSGYFIPSGDRTCNGCRLGEVECDPCI